MKFVPKKLTEGMTQKVAKAVFKTKKNSPHIFFAAGVVGVVGSTVLACKATLKLDEALDDIQNDVQTVKDAVEIDRITETEGNKHLIHIYAKGGVKILRLYAPSIALGTASLAALAGSHVQLVRRNAALSATLTLVTQAFEEYRDRVREEVGDNKELDLYRGIREEKIPGQAELEKIVDPNRLSPYSRIFDECSFRWTKDPEVNRMIVQCQQNYMNHKLHAEGFVFLNDVYDALGFERTRAGQVVGWMLGGDGDDYIDFGMFEASNSRFVNAIERSIVLDFNVDGMIWDKI